MVVESLRLADFRCYGEAEAEFAPGVNVISGPNAAGKTNLLESVYYFSSLRPIRSLREKEMVRTGAAAAGMELAVFSGGRRKQLSAVISAAGGKKLTRNGVRLRTNAEMLGDLRTVLFSPDDLFLIKGAAAERRRLLDRAISQLRPSYYSALAEYTRLLAQKQKILKEHGEKPSLLELLPSYNEKLAEYAGILISVRHSYVNKLTQYAGTCCESLSGGKDRLTAVYRSLSNIPDTSLPAAQLTELALAHLRSHREAELASASCLSGPHRDELEISINDQPARAFASQGQARTAALALKLAEREIFFRDTGEYPVLLLDDVLSELDPERQSGVLNRIQGGQVLITCCSSEAEPLSGRRFSVRNGRIAAVRDL